MRMRCIFMTIYMAVFAPVHAASSLDLTGFRGRVVYLDFWASWCGPCRQSFPWMEIMKSTYEVQGLEVVAVNLDKSRADADRFLKQFHPTFDVRFDPTAELPEIYKVQGMPSSVLIDRHGVTRFMHVGFRPVDGAIYEAQLRELLAEK
jgi:cytochrome c biogenesis protein CcmG, thiol:disulfide interchange protein DsbE